MSGADAFDTILIDVDAKPRAGRHAGLSGFDDDRLPQDLDTQYPGRGIELSAQGDIRRRRYHVQAGGNGETAFEHGATVGGDAGGFGDAGDLASSRDAARLHDLDA